MSDRPTLSVRVSEVHKNRIVEAARKRGISLTKYVRIAVFKQLMMDQRER